MTMHRRDFLAGTFALTAARAASASIAASDMTSWRSRISDTLFIPQQMPALAMENYGTFIPAEGVLATRVSYATLYGMRVPAIVYRPSRMAPRMPALVIVNGHAGDKSSWYSFYSGILYARAGAVVLTYDPIGEFERNSSRASESRAHDAVIPGEEMPRRLGGSMIADILQAVSYLAAQPEVDKQRIGVAAYSMGSLHAAIAGAIDTGIRALVLSGGGNLDGAEGYWDTSKPMCQAGVYRSLSFLGDRGAKLYALNQQRCSTLAVNGTADGLIVKPKTDKAFFTDLQARVAGLTGTRRNVFETYWFEGAGHRPNFVTRPVALWLQTQLSFPYWSPGKIEAMGESHVSEWAARTGAHVGQSFLNELSEGGVQALGTDVPNVPRSTLQSVPLASWEKDKQDCIYESWVGRATAAAQKDKNPKAFIRTES